MSQALVGFPVLHRKFGKGVVESVDSELVVVRFEQVGTLKFLIRYILSPQMAPAPFSHSVEDIAAYQHAKQAELADARRHEQEANELAEAVRLAEVATRQKLLREGLSSLFRRREIRQLVHFTRLSSVASILQSGILPRSEFSRLTNAPVVNDAVRADHCMDGISLSVSHPNDNLFVRWSRYDYQDQDWVVLSIDPEVLNALPCDLFYTNAATAWGAYRVPLVINRRPSSLEFERLFAEPGQGPTRAQLGHAMSDTTNPQAEVMVYGVIHPRRILCIACDNHTAVTVARQNLLQHGLADSIRVSVDLTMFNRRPCAVSYANAGAPSLVSQVGNGVKPLLPPHDFDDDIPF